MKIKRKVLSIQENNIYLKQSEGFFKTRTI